MEFTRILVAVDFGVRREAAFERALMLARCSGAELYVLHAVPAERPFSFRAAERLRGMADLRKRAADAGVAVQTVEQHGEAADIIALHANTRSVDLIVMSDRVRRRWGRRSSVAERVLRRTQVPTLVVPAEGAAPRAAFRHTSIAHRTRGRAGPGRRLSRETWRRPFRAGGIVLSGGG